jgi:hypothetical protein
VKLKWFFTEPPRGKGKGSRDSLEIVAKFLKIAAFASISIWAALAIYQMFPGRRAPALPAAITLLGAIVLASASQIMNFAGQWRARKRLKETHALLCLGCGFDLTKHGEEGICPECGREFSRQRLLEEWNRTYPELGMKTDDPIAFPPE